MIAIDTRQLNYHSWSGVEHYTYHVVTAMAGLRPLERFHLFFDSPPEPHRIARLRESENVSLHFRRGSLRFYALLPLDVLRTRSRVYYAMGGRLQYRLPVPAAITVHDILHLARPDLTDPATARMNGEKLRRSIPRADLVITVSEWSKQEIMEWFRLPSERVVVAPNAVEPVEAIERPRFVSDGRFILMVNPGRSNKNWEGAIRAFFEYRESAKDREISLVLAGALGSEEEGIQELVQRLRLQAVVVLAGYISGAQLAYLYKSAQLLVFPSWYEGFGVPVLEAMAYGTPVLTSNIPVIHEVAGGAAIEVDPADVIELAHQLTRLLSDPQLRSVHRELGLARAAQFSWSKSAEVTLTALDGL